jgi:hypothetical protein
MASQVAVSVPRSGPDNMFASTNRAGKCLMRMRRRELNRLTVCSGTSCLSETRNAALRASMPLIGVGLWDIISILSFELLEMATTLTAPAREKSTRAKPRR